MRQGGKVALNTLDQRLLVKIYVCDVLEATIFLQSLLNFLCILCFNNFNSSYSDAFFSISAFVIYLIIYVVDYHLNSVSRQRRKELND